MDKTRGTTQSRASGGRSKKNGKIRSNLVDVLDKLFEVKSVVPKTEKEFYSDQDSSGKMYIEPVDLKETEKNNPRLKRQQNTRKKGRKLKKLRLVRH